MNLLTAAYLCTQNLLICDIYQCKNYYSLLKKHKYFYFFGNWRNTSVLVDSIHILPILFWTVTDVQDCLKGLNQVKIQYTLRGCNGLAHSLKS